MSSRDEVTTDSEEHIMAAAAIGGYMCRPAQRKAPAAMGERVRGREMFREGGGDVMEEREGYMCRPARRTAPAAIGRPGGGGG